ncbi:hypothetical protein R3P38DRAFT_2598739 [Favolaschia claudopus]|uniref:Uncharacterized protein n=1 Tax=Favolaschia claudopus TaxID=2862362 RepID=A0AAW0DWG3_9AGAR
MAALIVLLALACLASFGFAYYLFTTRWDTTKPRSLLHLADESAQVVPIDSFRHSRRQYHSTERFLSYLPHSGLHNQRIALENAIVLGMLTNRTVLVPPIRLGRKPLRYVNFDSLHHELIISGKIGLRHCSRIGSKFLPPECFDYFDYTHVSSAWLFNLTTVEESLPLAYLDDLSNFSMRSKLDLSQSDIFTLRDLTPYHYRFVDTTHNSSSKFVESIYISDLARYPHRLLEIGTLFGSSRLRLRDKTNKTLRTRVRQCMDFSSPPLVNAANTISKALGHHFLGAHVRLKDGSFEANAQLTLQQVWWKLVCDHLQFNVSEASHLAQSLQVFSPPTLRAPLQNSRYHNETRPHLQALALSTFSMRCRGRRHTSAHLARLNQPLFISTDAKNPASDPLFSGFLRTFPCAFFLSDFDIYLKELDHLWNGYDGTLLRSFLIPLLDASVVGRAWAVAGTDGSTFSQFIQDVLWTQRHGLGIVERG